jgi:hypothetical protein
MGLFTDGKGRPELVVNPDIISGRAVYRPVDDSPAVEPVETPKQRARRELKKRMTEERERKKKTGDAPTEKG